MVVTKPLKKYLMLLTFVKCYVNRLNEKLNMKFDFIPQKTEMMSNIDPTRGLRRAISS
jgi:hypothetical protein